MRFSILAVIAASALSVNASYNDTAPTTVSTYVYPTYTPPPTTGTGYPVPSSNATKTPVGPSSPTSPAEFTGAANVNALPVGGLAALGVMMAYFI